jgi:hypothetical protein
MNKYEIIKAEKGVRLKGHDQDGVEQEIKVDKYTIKVEGIDKTLELLVRSDMGVPVEETIKGAVEEALKNLPANFKTSKSEERRKQIVTESDKMVRGEDIENK